MQPFGIIGFIGNAQREIDTILQQLHNLEFLTEYHLYNIGDLSNNLPGSAQIGCVTEDEPGSMTM